MRIGNHVRQWVALPGGSCDLRVGEGLLEEAGPILKGAVGRPRLAALLVDATASDDLAELLRRQLVDVGFVVRPVDLGDVRGARTPEAAQKLAACLASAAVTADDLVVAAGDADALSLSAHVVGAWQGGTSLVAVPTSLEAATSAIVTPRGIDVAGLSEAWAVRGCARHALCDPLFLDLSSDATLARAEMAATAFCASERAVGDLWDRAEALSAGDVEATCAQLADTARGRGQVASSTAAAVRASGAYGTTFARALARVAPAIDGGVALAEGLRFCARVSAALGLCSVDDVLTQDELLERLGIGLAVCAVDPAELVEAIRAERFARTSRLMLELPRSPGRVRLSTVDDALLREHAEAWCAARAIEQDQDEA